MAKKTNKNEDKTPANFIGKQKRFTSEYQPSGEAKSLGWKKKRSLEELKNEILDKSFLLVSEKLNDSEITSQELLSIFNKAVEMSGFKKEKQDVNIKSYSLFEEQVENKANEID